MDEDITGLVEINTELYSADLDEVGFEPEVIEDADENAANLFGY